MTSGGCRLLDDEAPAAERHRVEQRSCGQARGETGGVRRSANARARTLVRIVTSPGPRSVAPDNTAPHRDRTAATRSSPVDPNRRWSRVHLRIRPIPRRQRPIAPVARQRRRRGSGRRWRHRLAPGAGGAAGRGRRAAQLASAIRRRSRKMRRIAPYGRTAAPAQPRSSGARNDPVELPCVDAGVWLGRRPGHGMSRRGGDRIREPMRDQPPSAD